jgi:predicted transcriptional regulator
MKTMTVEEQKKKTITNLYKYSDLSVNAIAHQVDLEENVVQLVIDELTKDEALETLIELSTAKVEKIMSPMVVTIDSSKTPIEAAALMAENEIGSVIVTKEGEPFGIVTQSDIVRWVGKWPNLINSKLQDVVSAPLITVGRGTNVEEASEVMIGNRIHKLVVVDKKKLLGVVTITDLAVFLAPSRRPGLAFSVLQAIARGRKPKHS